MDGIQFTSDLMAWYDAHARDLPWRKEREPYGVWISEIMAQQTQMDRVVEYWQRWMERYPDLGALARASEEEVLKSWEGLGYYSRARNIRKAARELVDGFNGVFPREFEQIRSLPGVGEYTAGAIGSIAFDLPCPAVDANVLRVFARLMNVAAPVKTARTRARIQARVCKVMDRERPGDFNQAVMELGALVCTRNPCCASCPVKAHCRALERGMVDKRPVLDKPKQTMFIDMATGVLVHEGRVLIQKRRPDDIWPGLWEFPGGVIEAGETPREALHREYREEVELEIEIGSKLAEIKYSYTRYRVTMHCYLCRPANGEVPRPVFNEAVEGAFVLPGELSDYAFPAGHRRLLQQMLADTRFVGFMK